MPCEVSSDTDATGLAARPSKGACVCRTILRLAKRTPSRGQSRNDLRADAARWGIGECSETRAVLQGWKHRDRRHFRHAARRDRHLGWSGSGEWPKSAPQRASGGLIEAE
jgi:hypothetical protein